ncbi:MAG: hypothetical protein ABIW79_00855, partial [Gemmatimonas sp.]
AAQSELVNRRDIYGYDLLAWSLFKSGRAAEAKDAMQHALAQGTQDAMLLYHAGMIEQATGHLENARGFLRRALAIAPTFDGFAAPKARAALDAMPRSLAVGGR